MSKRRYIKIEELKALKNGVLLARLSCSKEIRKYFSSNLFYVKYDRDIHNVSSSILHIPVVSNLATFAWAIDADIYVKELDKTFLESLNTIKTVMEKWYPNLPFSTRINVGNTISNSIDCKGYGLLFSGGVDSTTSYIKHRDKKPNLIMIWGADVPPDKKDFWNRIKNHYEIFAGQENTKINFVRTNMRILNETILTLKFGKYLTDSSWWGALQHGIGLLGLCAPLTVTERIGEILIASSHAQGLLAYPWGSHPLIDNKVSWANVKVVHDGYNVSRQEKIRYVLKSYIKDTGRYPLLRVCWSQFSNFNCGKCEKCSRTITGLVLENIDPNKCGFNIDNAFFDCLKQNLVQRKFNLSPGRVFLWKDIQKYIPEEMSHSLYNCEEFFEWFKDFEISEIKRSDTHIKSYLLYLFYQLPKNMQKAILRFKSNDLIRNHLFRKSTK